MASGQAKAAIKEPNDWQTVNDPGDWQTVAPQGNAPSAPPPEPSMLQKAAGGVGDFFGGIGSGALHTLSTIGRPAGWLAEKMGAPKADPNSPLFQTHGTAGTIGKGLEQTAEFMIPGEAEEKGALKLAELAPKLGKYADPLAHILTSAAGSSAVNTAQGGSPVTGALMGAGGQVLGQGLKAAAPVIAETALGLPKAARAFGKTPGTALLDETRGIRPSTIAASAQERLGQLNPQLEQAADAASVRPNPVKALLPAPAQEIPLHNAPGVEGRLSEPIRLTQADRPMRPQLQSPSVSTPMASGKQAEFPERLASGDTGIRQTDFGSHPGMGQAQYIGEIPGERGGPGQSHGILIRPFEGGGGAIPPTIPNTSASLRPARSIIGTSADTASRQNAAALHGQLTDMGDTLSRHFDTGAEIPENVTPRQLLDLKRGFNDQHLTWNPETHKSALSTGRQAYNALDQELDRTVPESAGLNQRISSLIPVAQRAESISRGAPTLQRAAQRFGAHTGALTLGGIGGYQGYREGGVPGAIAGGLTGVLAPELIASPEGQMVLARTLNKANGLRPLVGGALQLDRKKGEQ
jgi:hypothetical protein